MFGDSLWLGFMKELVTVITVGNLSIYTKHELINYLNLVVVMLLHRLRAMLSCGCRGIGAVKREKHKLGIMWEVT